MEGRARGGRGIRDLGRADLGVGLPNGDERALVRHAAGGVPWAAGGGGAGPSGADVGAPPPALSPVTAKIQKLTAVLVIVLSEGFGRSSWERSDFLLSLASFGGC